MKILLAALLLFASCDHRPDYLSRAGIAVYTFNDGTPTQDQFQAMENDLAHFWMGHFSYGVLNTVLGNATVSFYDVDFIYLEWAPGPNKKFAAWLRGSEAVISRAGEPLGLAAHELSHLLLQETSLGLWPSLPSPDLTEEVNRHHSVFCQIGLPWWSCD